MTEFIIVFRETLEATLIIGIIYTILHKNKFNNLKKTLWLGVASSIVASLLFAIIVINLKHLLETILLNRFLKASSYILLQFIYYVIFGAKHVRIQNLKKNN